MIRRHRWRIILAVALFAFTFFYRFNTLGGALGGFDDDHFLHFAYAKQVQAGERPLRDFAGMGLQGAQPAIAYELSAAAQTWFGNNLRSEALLCVTALAVASVLTFLAATCAAPAWIAAGATVLSVLLAPKLYSYPKVLVLAAAAAAVVSYARGPSTRRAAVLAAITVAAFLFRHDLAVYVALAAAVVIAASARSTGDAIAAGARYGAITLIALAPTIYDVQREIGIAQYFRESVAQTGHETSRTQIPWPSFDASDLGAEDNAIAALYYAHLGLPLLLLAAVVLVRPGPPRDARAAIAAISVAALLVVPAFLRGNMGARFGDMGPWFAVLLAAGAGWAWRRGSFESLPTWTMRAVAAAGIVLLVTRSVWAVGSVTQELDASGWSDSVRKLTGQTRRFWHELGRLPRTYWSGDPQSASVAAVQYLHRCTSAADRIVVIGYEPELLPLADRRFAAGRAVIVPGFGTTEAEQQRMLRWWQVNAVPLVLAEDDPEWPRELPLVSGLLDQRYADAGSLAVDGGTTLRVYARRDPGPSGTFRELPCFH